MALLWRGINTLRMPRASGHLDLLSPHPLDLRIFPLPNCVEPRPYFVDYVAKCRPSRYRVAISVVACQRRWDLHQEFTGAPVKLQDL